MAPVDTDHVLRGFARYLNVCIFPFCSLKSLLERLRLSSVRASDCVPAGPNGWALVRV